MRKKIYSKYLSNKSEIKFKQLLNFAFGNNFHDNGGRIYTNPVAVVLLFIRSTRVD